MENTQLLSDNIRKPPFLILILGVIQSITNAQGVQKLFSTTVCFSLMLTCVYIQDDEFQSGSEFFGGFRSLVSKRSSR